MAKEPVKVAKKVEKSDKVAGLSFEDMAKIIKAKSPGAIFGEKNIYEFCSIKKIPTDIPTFDFLSGGGITKGRITILAGKPSACLGRDIPVLMYDGSLKMSQDVAINDLLMGDDSAPRKVINLFTGIDKLYQIDQSYGDSYIVNSQHLITVCNTEKNSEQIPFDINIEEYISKGETFKYRNRGIKTKIEYDFKEVEVDPYIIGLWLGDGHSKGTRISSSILDIKIVDYVKLFAKNNNLKTSIYKDTRNENGININISGIIHKQNSFLDTLRSLNLINNKHIPDIYLINSRSNRLKLLAGLLDSDGDYNNSHKSFNFTNKNKLLIDQTITLCRSLGYKTNLFKRTINGECYSIVGINGDNLNEIPVLLDRKKADSKEARKNWLLSALDITPIGEGEYFGFEVIGNNNRFVLGDFTITHNCKTTMTLQIVAKIIRDLKASGQKKYVLYFDPEGAYDAAYATQLGIDQSYMIINRVNKVIEEAFQIADDMISMGFVEAMVFDSLDGMVARKTDENAYQATMGGASGAVAQHLPNLFSKIIEYEVTTIFIKQARVKMGGYNPSGQEIITFSGGYALRHFTDSIYVLGRRKRQGNEGMNDIVIKAEKTRSTRMGLDCVIPLPVRGLGIDMVTDLVALAIGQGIISTGGGGWTTYRTFKEQGLVNFVDAISESPEILKELKEDIYDNIINKMSVVGVSNNDGEKLVLSLEDKEEE